VFGLQAAGVSGSGCEVLTLITMLFFVVHVLLMYTPYDGRGIVSSDSAIGPLHCLSRVLKIISALESSRSSVYIVPAVLNRTA
jgi:hypothetical protein